MKLAILVFGLALSFADAAFASVGAAGCGLGSMIIEKNTIVSQTLAETTNASTATQFFGITTGTSNCNANGFVFVNREATVFAEANLPSLKVEMARGTGENLKAFSQTLGCKDSDQFSKMTKSHYQNIFPSEDVGAHQMLENVKAEIQKDQALKQACTITG